MTSVDRLSQFIVFKQISKREFYANTGLSNGFLDKSKNVGSDNLERILRAYPELNLYWIVKGEGEMLKNAERYGNTPTANHHVSDINVEYMAATPTAKPPPDDRNLKKNVSPTVSPTPFFAPKVVVVAEDKKENILFVPVKAAAGYLNGYADTEYIQTLPSFRLPGLNEGSYRAFEVQGSSMVPTLESGEMVIGKWVEKLEYIREDRVHVVVTKNGGIIVKRLLNRIDNYGYLVAKSDAVDNRNEYPNLHIYPTDILEIWYAVWHGGFNFKAPAEMYKRLNNLEADLTEVMRILRTKGDIM